MSLTVVPERGAQDDLGVITKEERLAMRDCKAASAPRTGADQLSLTLHQVFVQTEKAHVSCGLGYADTDYSQNLVLLSSHLNQSIARASLEIVDLRQQRRISS